MEIIKNLRSINTDLRVAAQDDELREPLNLRNIVCERFFISI